MTDIQLKSILDAIINNDRLEDILRSMAAPGVTTPELDWIGDTWGCYWIFDGSLYTGYSPDPRHAVWVAVAAAAREHLDDAAIEPTRTTVTDEAATAGTEAEGEAEATDV